MSARMRRFRMRVFFCWGRVGGASAERDGWQDGIEGWGWRDKARGIGLEG